MQDKYLNVSSVNADLINPSFNTSSHPSMAAVSQQACYIPDWYKNPKSEPHGILPLEQFKLSSIKAKKEALNLAVEWQLPGFSDPGELCGKITYVLACPDHQKRFKRVNILGSHCFNPGCPVCYSDYWASREASRATDRLLEAEFQYKNLGFGIGVIKHIVISPPQDAAIKLISTQDGYRRLRSAATYLLKAGGCLGGVLIFHPYRKRHVDNGSPCESRFCKRKHEWVLSPHFHFVGYGYFMSSKKFFDCSGGWVYKNLGRRDNVFGTIHYLLTHCGLGYSAASKPGHDVEAKEGVDDQGFVPVNPVLSAVIEGKQDGQSVFIHDKPYVEAEEKPILRDRRVFNAVSWFGIFSNHNLRVAARIKVFEDAPRCPVCNHELHKFFVGVHPGGTSKKVLSAENWFDTGEYFKTRIVRCYAVRPPPNMSLLLIRQMLLMHGFIPNLKKPLDDICIGLSDDAWRNIWNNGNPGRMDAAGGIL